MKRHRILLVNGASSDTGKVLIDSLAPQFDLIYAHFAHSGQAVSTLQSSYGEKIIPVQANFSSEDEISAMISRIMERGEEPDSILHLPSLPYQNRQFRKLNWREFQAAIDIQLRSLMLLSQAFLPLMAKQHFGRIAVILSAVTINTPPSYLCDYVTAKYALLGFCKALAAEYANKGITVNAVSPDMMETKLLDHVPRLIIDQNAASSPMGRNARPEDLIPFIKALLSDESDFITGQNVAITGGR